MNNKQRVVFCSYEEFITLSACAKKHAIALSAFGCLRSHELDNWTEEEIRALQGQQKDEYCG